MLQCLSEFQANRTPFPQERQTTGRENDKTNSRPVAYSDGKEIKERKRGQVEKTSVDGNFDNLPSPDRLKEELFS